MSLLEQSLVRTEFQRARPAPSPRRGEGWGEGVRTDERFDPPHPALLCRKSTLPSPRWGEGAITAAALTVLVVLTAPAHAQDYPNRPITLVVPYAAGGGNDLFARIASEKMSRTLGQQIVIENRPGAGGSTATRAVAKAAPDGYTLVIGGTGTLAVNPTLYQNVGYDPRKDFAPVGLIGTSARSPSAIASVISCVTKMMVLRLRLHSRSKSSCSCARVCASTAPNGSSIRMTGGS